MCQTTVYLDNKIYLENVASIEFKEKEVRLNTLFNDPRNLKANIKSIDFIEGNVFLDSKKEVKQWTK